MIVQTLQSLPMAYKILLKYFPCLRSTKPRWYTFYVPFKHHYDYFKNTFPFTTSLLLL